MMKTEAGARELQQIQKEEQAKGNGPKELEPSEAGSTANVILITKDHIYCANAGDSRTVASVDKKLVALSEDHKPEDEK